jgi:hypothetical protein
MKTPALIMALGLVLGASASFAEEKYERKSADEWKYEYNDGFREMKVERKPDGGWKEEYKDEFCEVKREMKSSGEYKEEVKCK